MMLQELPEMAKPKEVAAYLRVSVNAVYDAVNREDNPLPAVRLGPHGLRVTRHQLASWLGLPINEETAKPDSLAVSEASTDHDNIDPSG